MSIIKNWRRTESSSSELEITRSLQNFNRLMRLNKGGWREYLTFMSPWTEQVDYLHHLLIKDAHVYLILTPLLFFTHLTNYSPHRVDHYNCNLHTFDSISLTNCVTLSLACMTLIFEIAKICNDQHGMRWMDALTLGPLKLAIIATSLIMVKAIGNELIQTPKSGSQSKGLASLALSVLR